MEAAPFVHLHVHSEYSLLNATCRTKELAATAAEMGMPAVALTDQGNLFGTIEFYKACRGKGVTPIIGAEIYMAPGALTERKSGREMAYRSLVLLCESREGYNNLMEIVSEGHLAGFHYKPRIDRAYLEPRTGGLLALSGGPGGEINMALAGGQTDLAEDTATYYRDLFGPGRFYLELQDHGLESEKAVNRQLIELGKKLDIPLVATNAVNYLRQADAAAHEVLLCIQHGAHLADENHPRLPSPEYYFKSPEEMAALFPHVPEALSNTLVIAERCNCDIELGVNKFPKYVLPEGHTNMSYLRELCYAGLTERYGERAKDQDIIDRLEMELGVIESTGFIDYFIIVWDFINYAKKENIPVGLGRGSAAGAMVAYVLGITDLDPLRYALYFERFLNPERISPPDVDIDFCYNRRPEVIDYVRRKYGERSVAQIITYGTLGAKMVVRDVGRVLGLSYGEADRLAKMIPFDPKMTLKRAMDENPEFKEAYENEETTRQIIDYAFTLEGLSRQAGVHAAGVVIADGELTKNVPLTTDDSGGIVTQYSMDPLGEVGALKMDFLGLKTLTVIQDCLDLIEAKTGQKIEPGEIPLEDEKTFELLQRARNTGLFQVESPGMCDLCRRLKPSNIEDIIALVALYRPGPMENIPAYGDRKLGKVEIEYAHPLLEPILKDTYGIMIYQEQVMMAARVLAGYTLGGADMLRRAMGKKKKEVMDAERAKFTKGCAELNGIEEKHANELFDTLEKFAGYGFNKAHSACYGVLAYQTAWLKANHPVEFMAALMSNDMDNTDKIALFINEARSLGIEVRPPDINASRDVFTVEVAEDGTRAIRYGMAAIKNVGREAVRQIVAARDSGGAFNSVAELATRVGARSLNRKLIESLVKAGALDSLDAPRELLIAQIDGAMAEAGAIARDKEAGQASMFDLLGPLDEPPARPVNGNGRAADYTPWPLTERLAYEKELLGYYISGHPIDDFAPEMRALQLSTVEGLGELKAQTTTRLAGMLTGVQVRTSKKDGRPWARLTFEDGTGATELLCFSDAYAALTRVPQAGEVCAVVGEVDKRDEQPKMLVREIKTLGDARKELYKAVVLEVELAGWRETDWRKLRDVICDHPGDLTLYLRCVDAEGNRVMLQTGDPFRVEFTTELLDKVEPVLGHTRYDVVASKQLPKRERRWGNRQGAASAR